MTRSSPLRTPRVVVVVDLSDHLWTEAGGHRAGRGQPDSRCPGERRGRGCRDREQRPSPRLSLSLCSRDARLSLCLAPWVWVVSAAAAAGVQTSRPSASDVDSGLAEAFTRICGHAMGVDVDKHWLLRCRRRCRDRETRCRFVVSVARQIM